MRKSPQRIKFDKIKVKKYWYDALQLLLPPEDMTVSEWAEKARTLDSTTSAIPGLWSNSTTPYLVGIMDEFNNYMTEEIIFCKPTQVGGTEAMLNMIGYIIEQNPSPTMVVYPTDKIAQWTSRNRVQKMVKLAPSLNKRYDDNSELLELQFDGMFISLVGSNSPAGLASKPIKYLFLDEVDKYPGASKKEADPIELARERTKTFPNRKIYMTSTPTTKSGHIWEAKEGADCEKHFFVPCPHCKEYIELKFSNIRFPKEAGMSHEERAELANYVCQACGCFITDSDKNDVLKKGEWRTVRQKKDTPQSVAFWMNTLYSPFVRFSTIAREFLKSKDDPEKFQNFVNSWLAEPWEDTHLKTDADLVRERQTDLDEFTVPSWAKIITAGVDVQETSLYYSIRAWGDFLTSQLITRGQALSFEEIDRVMNLEYRKEDGTAMIVQLCLVDSGDQTDDVYDFCMEHSEWALPVKGSSHAQLSHYKLSKINKEGSSAYGMTLVLVDGGKYKDMIAGRMQKSNGKGSWMVFNGIDDEYCEQVTAEEKVNVKGPGGEVKQVWRPKHSHADNHYLDSEVYSMTAADILGVRSLHLRNQEEVGREQKEESGQPQQPEDKYNQSEWLTKHDDWLG